MTGGSLWNDIQMEKETTNHALAEALVQWLIFA